MCKAVYCKRLKVESDLVCVILESEHLGAKFWTSLLISTTVFMKTRSLIVSEPYPFCW